MRALVYTGPQTLEVQERPRPTGDVVVRVGAVGICGSELHGWHGHDPRRRPGLVMGHEAAGTIVEGPRQGQRVAFNPLVSCQICRACVTGRTNLCDKRELIGMNRPGAFAEYVSVPERNLVELPEGLPLYRATLMEPCATALHALALAAAWPAERALVFGGGSVGLLGALVLQARGVDTVLAEINPLRRASASNGGLQACERPEGRFDLVYDAVGVDATRAEAMQRLNPGGVLVHVGLGGGRGGLDPRTLTLFELSVLGSYTYTDADLVEALRFLTTLDTPFVERRPLSEGQRAFEDLDAGRTGAAKILLEP